MEPEVRMLRPMIKTGALSPTFHLELAFVPIRCTSTRAVLRGVKHEHHLSVQADKHDQAIVKSYFATLRVYEFAGYLRSRC
jgi:hypothetical protein